MQASLKLAASCSVHFGVRQLTDPGWRGDDTTSNSFFADTSFTQVSFWEAMIWYAIVG